MKGLFLGSCNRTYCQAPGANWYNHSTRAYYCESCARRINLLNKVESFRLFGHDLCTEQPTNEDQAEEMVYFPLRELCFHQTNDNVKALIDATLEKYPAVLKFHPRPWFYVNF